MLGACTSSVYTWIHRDGGTHICVCGVRPCLVVKKFLDFNTVAFSFVYDKYYLITD